MLNHRIRIFRVVKLMSKKLKFLAAVTLMLATMSAGASTFVAMSDKDLIRESQAVIQGTVTDVESFWDPSGQIILTEATINIKQRLVGGSPPSVKVRTFGGQVDDFLVEAQGFPEFKQGDEVIVFLYKEAADDSIRVRGYQQGLFRVVTRLDGVTLAVPTLDEDVRFFSIDGRPGKKPTSEEIDQFKRRIKETALSIGRNDVH